MLNSKWSKCIACIVAVMMLMSCDEPVPAFWIVGGRQEGTLNGHEYVLMGHIGDDYAAGDPAIGIIRFEVTLPTGINITSHGMSGRTVDGNLSRFRYRIRYRVNQDGRNDRFTITIDVDGVSKEVRIVEANQVIDIALSDAPTRFWLAIESDGSVALVDAVSDAGVNDGAGE